MAGSSAVYKTQFFWSIEDKEKTVGYLLGSVHKISREILEKLDPKIGEGLTFCDTLGVEVDVRKEKSSVEASPANPKYRGKQVEQKRNIVIMESFFADKAEEMGKVVVELESAETHKEAVGEDDESDLDEEDYEGFDEFVGQGLDQVAQFFQTGTIEALEEQFRLQNLSEQRKDNKRNREMVETIDGLIKSGKKPFAMSGAMHFAGPQGIGELLKQKGYTMTQIFLRTNFS